jgi:hypothetical protein
VIQVLFNGGAATTYKINETDVAKAQLEQKLVVIYATRQEKVRFVKGGTEHAEVSLVVSRVFFQCNGNKQLRV